MSWQRTRKDSDYAHETECTRCGDSFIKEIKAGQAMNARRAWWGDTRWMCKLCTLKTNLVVFGILAVVGIPIAILLAL